MVYASSVLRLGTRGSLLARTQSAMVAEELQTAHPGLRVEQMTIKTSGDQIKDRPLYDAGGKGLFVKELEQALLDRQIDFAVHSMKDVPVTMPLVDESDLIIAAVPKREEARDVLVSARAKSLAQLPAGARIGTTSPRRRCQILAARADVHVEPLRGNIDTRLNKLSAGDYDAIVLAAAGLRRVDRFDPAMMSVLDPSVMLPAAGQGALCLQCRRDDRRTRERLAGLNDPDTAEAVAAERAVVAELNGDCHSPIAAWGTLTSATIHLRAAIGARDGNPPVVRAEAEAGRENYLQAVAQVVASLKAQGAENLLRPAR